MKNNYQLTKIEISFFSENMHTMLSAGIQPVDAVKIICDDLNDTKLKGMLTKLAEDIEETYSVHGGVFKADCFPKYFLDMIEIGEVTGKLDTVFKSLASYYEKEDRLSKKIKNAVMYPIIIVCFMAAIVFFLVFSVMPIFEQVFAQMGTGISSGSMSSMGLGLTLGRVSVILISVILVGILMIYIMSRTKKGSTKLKELAETFILTRSIVYQVQVSKLAYALATFLSSGIDTDKAMMLSLQMIDHKNLSKKIQKCIDDMEKGKSLAEAISDEKIFGSIYGRMFISSMKTGSQDTVMSRLADIYENQTSENIDSFIASIVPLSVFTMTIIVGLVLASVMMPLVGIISAMG